MAGRPQRRPQCRCPGEEITVRVIPPLTSAIADRVLRQVNAVPFTSGNDSPILLQGETVSSLTATQMEGLKETYQAGYSLVLLDPTM
jgi:hypothetical protein